MSRKQETQGQRLKRRRQEVMTVVLQALRTSYGHDNVKVISTGNVKELRVKLDNPFANPDYVRVEGFVEF